MKQKLVLILFLTLVGSHAESNKNPQLLDVCQPIQDNQDRYRWAVKTDPSPIAAPVQPVTVTQMLAWKALAIGPDDSDAARVTGSPEASFYKLEGFVQRLGFNDDGDMHLEIAQTDNLKQPRIIAEVPAGQPFCAVRQAFIAALSLEGINVIFPSATGIHWKRPKTKTSSSSYNLPRALKVSLVGKAFWDGIHVGGVGHGSKEANASDWEIHPIRKVSFSVAGKTVSGQ